MHIWAPSKTDLRLLRQVRGRYGDLQGFGHQWVNPAEGQRHWIWICQSFFTNIHLLIILPSWIPDSFLQHFTWCFEMISESLLLSSWSSVGSRYTTGKDIQLFCGGKKCQVIKVKSVVGSCLCVFAHVPLLTWMSTLSIAPNISTFLSVLDGFCRSNLRL